MAKGGTWAWSSLWRKLVGSREAPSSTQPRQTKTNSQAAPPLGLAKPAVTAPPPAPSPTSATSQSNPVPPRDALPAPVQERPAERGIIDKNKELGAALADLKGWGGLTVDLLVASLVNEDAARRAFSTLTNQARQNAGGRGVVVVYGKLMLQGESLFVAGVICPLLEKDTNVKWLADTSVEGLQKNGLLRLGDRSPAEFGDAVSPLGVHGFVIVQSTAEGQRAEDDYVRRCLESRFREGSEDRKWDSPECQKVIGPLNSGKNEEAARQADVMAAQGSDLDLYYDWGATAKLRMKDFDGARSLLLKGLDRAKRKHNLCEGMGEVEWKAGNVRDAIYWWAQAIHCQESIQHYDEGPYLHLHYVAGGLGLPSDVSSSFISKVDQIRRGGVRLNNSAAADLLNLTREQKSPGMPKVVIGLYEKYFRQGQPPQVQKADQKAFGPVVDLRSEEEKTVERNAQQALPEEDEAISRKLVVLLQQSADQDRMKQSDALAKTSSEIKAIGSQLYARGGHRHMLQIHYRVNALGGKARSLEMYWDGIGEWEG